MKRLLLPSLVILSGGASAEPEIRPELQNLAQLRRGEILYELTHLDEPGAGIRAEILIRAPVEAIWATLKGCKKALVFVDGLEQCDTKPFLQCWPVSGAF